MEQSSNCLIFESIVVTLYVRVYVMQCKLSSHYSVDYEWILIVLKTIAFLAHSSMHICLAIALIVLRLYSTRSIELSL